jgi:uncharacterized protein with PQ loop repeat
MQTLIATIATVSGTVSAFLPALQIREMWTRGTSRGISVPFLCGVLANLAIWTAYSVALHRPNMVFTSAASLFMNALMLTVVLGLRRRRVRELPTRTIEA